MRFIRLLCALAVAAGAAVALEAQEGGGGEPTKVAAAKKPVKKKAVKRGPRGQAAVRRGQDAGAVGGARHRLLRQGLPCRRRCAAHRRCGLAGHAPLAQPQLGPPQARRARREAGDRGEGARRLARAPGRRPVAAARRADADGPCQPPGRARCRHLAHPHARPAPDRAGAGGALRHIHAGGRPGVGRSQGVDRRPRAPAQARRLLRRAWSAFSCIRPSRRRCARRPPRTRSQRGRARSAPIGATTIISTCASPAPRAAPTARRSRRSPPTTAAAPSSSAGSPW